MSRKNRVWAVTVGMALFTGLAQAQQESVAGPVRRLRYVYAAETNSAVNGQGTVIKRDSGRLVYQDAVLFRGAVRVEEGSVVLGTSLNSKLAALPYGPNPSLTNGLAFWVDASSNVVSDAGAVTRWFDVRDAAVMGEGGAAQTNYPWAEAFSGATPPTLAQAGAGRVCMDFGALNSGAWLQWASAATNALQLTNVCSVVLAVACENGGGCFFGSSVTSHFARGSASAGGSRFFWKHGASSPYLIQGDVFVDEVRVDALKATPKAGEQVLAFVARKDSGLPEVWASNFGKDRTLETGGFKLYEALVYNRILTEAERMRVSDYLDGKWFKRSIAGDLEVCSAASAEIAADAGRSLVSGKLRGGGAVTKSGAGDWVIENAEQPFAGQIRLTEGALTNASPVRQALPFALDAETPLSVVAEGRSWRAAGAQTPGVLEKSGAGEWLVTGLPQTGVQTVRVAAGTLRLAGREIGPAAAESEGAAVIFEDSFEFPFAQLAYSLLTLPGIKYSLGVYGDGWVDWPQVGWTCRVNDPDTGTRRNPAVVLCNEGYNPAIVVPGGAEQGNQAMLLQGKGEIRRTVDFPAAGNYVLSFWAAARSTSICVNHTFDVCIDGVVLTNVLTSVYTHFRYYQVPLTNMTAGVKEVRFTGTNTLAPAETYRASVLDGIRITSVTAHGGVQINDPGFEAGAWTTSSPSAPADGLWQFLADSGWSAAINTHGANLYKRGAPEGVKAAWLKNTANFAATNVTFAQAGTYALTFLASARQTSGDAEAVGGCWPGHDYRVFFNGVACGYGRTMNRRFERQEMLFDVAAPGTYPVRFFGLNETDLQYFAGQQGYPTNRLSLFDCVNVRKVDGATIPDYSFENNNTVNWKWLNNGGVTSASGNNFVALSGVPDGPSSLGRAGILLGAGQMYQDVAIPSDGVYRLSFYAAGRFLFNGALDPARTTAAARLGHDFRARVDSNTVIEVQTRDEMFRQYAARLPLLKAGTHRLSFEGLNTLGGGDRASAVDAVRLTRIETETSGGLLPSGAVVEVAEGAVLHLDYLGTNSVKAVKLGGQAPSGVITAGRFPTYIQGPGALYTPPRGTLISVQ